MTQPASPARQKTAVRAPLLAACILAAAIINVALLLIFKAAGADFVNTVGVQVGVANVLVMTVVPLLVGFAVVAFASRRNPAFLRIGRWVGIGLALLTIVMTATVGFDSLGFIGLALMHIVVAAAIAVGLRPAKR
ncbi:DUF6069 family protein [Arthrobacter citreus]|jgi:hypothetical protein|uniref:DUF6069 family protein n=1 Tax=Arthrobacter citreus TaxID=1670 RepID=A0ABZ3A1A3_9MICC